MVERRAGGLAAQASCRRRRRYSRFAPRTPPTPLAAHSSSTGGYPSGRRRRRADRHFRSGCPNGRPCVRRLLFVVAGDRYGGGQGQRDHEDDAEGGCKGPAWSLSGMPQSARGVDRMPCRRESGTFVVPSRIVSRAAARCETWSPSPSATPPSIPCMSSRTSPQTGSGNSAARTDFDLRHGVSVNRHRGSESRACSTCAVRVRLSRPL